MAILLETTVMGITIPDAYYKITEVKFSESGEKTDAWEKIYNIQYIMNSYTNSTKEFDINQSVVSTTGTEAEITIANGYNFIKTLPFYSEAKDA